MSIALDDVTRAEEDEPLADEVGKAAEPTGQRDDQPLSLI